MNLERLKMLEEFIREDPSDPFNRYALALEYQVFDKARARELFERLLASHPAYVPSYYQAGNLALDAGDEVRARDILNAGLAAARAVGDRKAESELRALADALD